MAHRRKPQAKAAPTRPMAVRPARRAAAPAPASRPTAQPLRPALARAGQRAALVMAGTGLLWALATWAGGAWGWPQRLRALLDLFALAGFGLGLWMTFQAWRLRRRDAE